MHNFKILEIYIITRKDCGVYHEQCVNVTSRYREMIRFRMPYLCYVDVKDTFVFTFFMARYTHIVYKCTRRRIVNRIQQNELTSDDKIKNFHFECCLY
jgi:hypothetical protein